MPTASQGEEYAEFALGDAVLRGIVHRPEYVTAPPVLLFSGWGGTRYGPNGILVEAARLFAEDGRIAVRFDFRGRGDSDGAVGAHDLACHIEDARAIADWTRERVDERDPVLLGICSGGEVVVGALFAGVDASAVCLWSAPVFAAEGTAERKARKRAGYLKAYGAKLFRAETWRKLAAGEVRVDIVRRGLRGAGTHEKKDSEPEELSGEATFEARCGAALLVYGGADPIAGEALPAYRGLFERAGCGSSEHTVPGANHGFYALPWKREVIEVTRSWLAERAAPSSP